jgi:hypothetical protein
VEEECYSDSSEALESDNDSQPVKPFSHDDLEGEYIDPKLMQKPRVNYFVKQIDLCSRYAVAFAKNIKYLMGGLVPENEYE